MNALLFWFSAGLATLWTLLAACWWAVEDAGFKSTWLSGPVDSSEKLLWLGCPIKSKAFAARVDALQEILTRRPPKCLILSGTEEEVLECQRRLQIPSQVEIELDTNGIRTYASIANLSKTEQPTTVISHRFHLKRVAFIAAGLDQPVLLYPVGKPLGPWTSKARWREAFARLRAVTDRLFPPNETQTKRIQS